MGVDVRPLLRCDLHDGVVDCSLSAELAELAGGSQRAARGHAEAAEHAAAAGRAARQSMVGGGFLRLACWWAGGP